MKKLFYSSLGCVGIALGIEIISDALPIIPFIFYGIGWLLSALITWIMVKKNTLNSVSIVALYVAIMCHVCLLSIIMGSSFDSWLLIVRVASFFIVIILFFGEFIPKKKPRD